LIRFWLWGCCVWQWTMGCRTTLTKYFRQKCFLQTKLFLFFVCFTRIALGTLRTDSYLSFAIGRKVRSGDKSIARSFLLIKKIPQQILWTSFLLMFSLTLLNATQFFFATKMRKKNFFPMTEFWCFFVCLFDYYLHLLILFCSW